MYTARMESYMTRSVSMHGCSELLSQSSLPGPQGTGFSISLDLLVNLIFRRRVMLKKIMTCSISENW